jgi:hypothetical protein
MREKRTWGNKKEDNDTVIVSADKNPKVKYSCIRVEFWHIGMLKTPPTMSAV